MFKTPHLNPLEWLSAIILILGGLNLLILGLFEYDVIAEICGETFGTTNAASRTLYIIVGIAAIYTLFGLVRMEMMTSRERRDVEPSRQGAMSRGAR